MLGWGADKAKTAKVGQSANGGGKAGPYLKEGGVLSYYEICEKITKDNAKVTNIRIHASCLMWTRRTRIHKST